MWVPMPSNLSVTVAAGMKRICADFTKRVAPFGFVKSGARVWRRERGRPCDTIYFHRSGSTYGAPRTASVDIRVELSVRSLDGLALKSDSVVHSTTARRFTGYAYHHRFNAETWSTYDRCLDELTLFVTEFAEPWFATAEVGERE